MRVATSAACSARRSSPSETAPEGINFPALRDRACLPKAFMYPVSPKAQRNRFAYFRAQELFMRVQRPMPRPGHPDILTTPPGPRLWRVRDGLSGFKSTAASALL